MKHKKHKRNKKSEFSGSYKISASHLLETKIRGLKKPQTTVLKWEIIQKK